MDPLGTKHTDIRFYFVLFETCEAQNTTLSFKTSFGALLS